MRFVIPILAGLCLVAAVVPAATAAMGGPGRPTPIWIPTATALASGPSPTAGSTPPTPATPALDEVAVLMLYVSGASDNAQAIVEWQDGLGGWHPVGGWSGPLDAGWHGAAWAVLPANFGQGPFRWRVFRLGDETFAAATQSFWLPAAGGDTQVYWISMESP